MKHKMWILTGCFVVLLGAIGIWLPSISKDQPNKADSTKHNLPSSSPSISIIIPDVTPEPSPVIENSNPLPIIVPEIKPEAESVISEPPVLQPEKEVKHVESPITRPKPTPKTTEPPKPKPKTTDKPQSPAAPPTYEEKETKPNATKKDEPKAGDTNGKGQVFFPGFGWVDQGGPNQSSKSTSDGDWNKQVGTMD